jgi:hypothetical protein
MSKSVTPRLSLLMPATGLLMLSLCAGGTGVALAQDASAKPSVLPPSAVPQGPPTATPPASTQSPAASSSFPPQPPAPNRPGFIHQLETWWNDGFSGLNEKMKDAKGKIDDLNKKSGDVAKDAASATQEAVRNAAEATKNATNAVVHLPTTRITEVREVCTRAPNGAPDCEMAAKSACQKKGFGEGKPLDVRSAENCPATVLLSGRTPIEGECPVETVVLRAICN